MEQAECGLSSRQLQSRAEGLRGAPKAQAAYTPGLSITAAQSRPSVMFKRPKAHPHRVYFDLQINLGLQ